MKLQVTVLLDHPVAGHQQITSGVLQGTRSEKQGGLQGKETEFVWENSQKGGGRGGHPIPNLLFSWYSPIKEAKNWSKICILWRLRKAKSCHGPVFCSSGTTLLNIKSSCRS